MILGYPDHDSSLLKAPSHLLPKYRHLQNQEPQIFRSSVSLENLCWSALFSGNSCSSETEGGDTHLHRDLRGGWCRELYRQTDGAPHRQAQRDGITDTTLVYPYGYQEYPLLSFDSYNIHKDDHPYVSTLYNTPERDQTHAVSDHSSAAITATKSMWLWFFLFYTYFLAKKLLHARSKNNDANSRAFFRFVAGPRTKQKSSTAGLLQGSLETFSICVEILLLLLVIVWKRNYRVKSDYFFKGSYPWNFGRIKL